MRAFKQLFYLSLISGILIFSMGLFLKISNITSAGSGTNINGTVFHISMNGLGAIFIGLLILLFSILCYRMYKFERNKFNKME